MDVQQAIADLFAREEATAEPSPGIALRLASLLRGGDYAMAELERLAVADPAIAVELLCAARHAGDLEASLPRALARIGERGLFTIASSVARRAEGFAALPLAAARRSAWRHALVSAVLCRELARERGLPGDAAYACGLLHDIGQLVALSAVEQLASGARAGAAAPGWQRIVARWHAPLGAAFAARRGLPAPVADAIALHHSDPPLPQGRSPELVSVVRTVDATLRVLGGELPATADLPSIAELSTREAERLASARDTVVRHVDELDAVPGPHPAPASSAAPPRAAGGRGILFRIAAREYAATGLAAGHLVLTGPAPLGEGALVDVEPVESGGGAFQVIVIAGWQDGNRHRAIVAPLSSPGATLGAAAARGVA